MRFTEIKTTIVIMAVCLTGIGVAELLLNGEDAQLALAVVTALGMWGREILSGDKGQSKP